MTTPVDNQPVTVVATFQVKDGRFDDFEDAIAGQMHLMVQAVGFLGATFARSLKQPDQYLLTSTWRDGAAYTHLVSQVRFANYSFGPLQSLAVGDSDRGQTLAERFPSGDGETGVVALTRFTLKNAGATDAFEEAFTSHAEFVRSRDGFVAHRFVRSTREPARYLNLGWWRDADAYLAVLHSPEFQADAKTMAPLVAVDGGLYRIVQSYVPVAA